MNVGKSTVIEAVQDVVESLFDLRNEYTKFPETEQETAALISTFAEYSDFPNIAGAIDGTHIRVPRLAQLVRSLTANQEVPGSSPGLVEG